MTPPKTFDGRLSKDVHRVILDLLEQAAGCELNGNMLRAGREEFGRRANAAQPKAKLHWLEEQGCLNAEPRKNILAAKLTRRGETSWRPN